MRFAGKFVRREFLAGRAAGPALLADKLAISEPESEGYDPYDHAPPHPADDRTAGE